MKVSDSNSSRFTRRIALCAAFVSTVLAGCGSADTFNATGTKATEQTASSTASAATDAAIKATTTGPGDDVVILRFGTSPPDVFCGTGDASDPTVNCAQAKPTRSIFYSFQYTELLQVGSHTSDYVVKLVALNAPFTATAIATGTRTLGGLGPFNNFPPVVSDYLTIPDCLPAGDYTVWVQLDVSDLAGQNLTQFPDRRANDFLSTNLKVLSWPGGGQGCGGTAGNADLAMTQSSFWLAEDPTIAQWSAAPVQSYRSIYYRAQVTNIGSGASAATDYTAKLVAPGQSFDATALAIKTVTNSLPVLAPGASQVIEGFLPVPETLPAGGYTLWLQVDSSNKGSQTTTAHGNDAAARWVTLGTWSATGGGGGGGSGHLADLAIQTGDFWNSEDPSVVNYGSVLQPFRSVFYKAKVSNSGSAASHESDYTVKLVALGKPFSASALTKATIAGGLKASAAGSAGDQIISGYLQVPECLAPGGYTLWIGLDTSGKAGQGTNRVNDTSSRYVQLGTRRNCAGH